MRSVQSTTLLLGFLATLVLSSAAVLAIEVDASVDKRIVTPGGTLTVTATVTDDDGNPGSFDYRIAVIAPGQRHGGERIIVCDSEKQSTNGASNVTFACSIPTLEGLQELGVKNAAERTVIPLKGGIAVIDPETNETEKEHGKALIVNTDKFKASYENALERLDGFIAKAQEAIAKCENITARAEEAGAEGVIERCASFTEKMQEKIDDAVDSQERINNALDNLGNLTSFDFDDLKGKLMNFRDGAGDFKIDLKDLRDFVGKARADLERRVAKEIVDAAKERAKEIRESMKEKRGLLDEKLREVKEDRMDREAGIVDSEDDASEGEDEDESEDETDEEAEESNSTSSGSGG